MVNNPSVLSRISHWFKPAQDATPLPLESAPDSEQTIPVTTYLKPWAKRDAALSQLQEGFVALTDLMSAVKASLDRQSQRHDQLLRILQHLPEALRAIPENARTQTETLKVVGEQLQRHNLHYHRIADALETASHSVADQKQALDALNDRVETISRHDQSLADNMRSVSSAMEGVSQNTQASAHVLDQLNNHSRQRDLDLQSLLHRQSNRVTVMLGVALLLSVAACTTAALLAWKLLH
jgi:chromosome segregation ATPase